METGINVHLPGEWRTLEGHSSTSYLVKYQNKSERLTGPGRIDMGTHGVCNWGIIYSKLRTKIQGQEVVLWFIHR